MWNVCQTGKKKQKQERKKEKRSANTNLISPQQEREGIREIKGGRGKEKWKPKISAKDLNINEERKQQISFLSEVIGIGNSRIRAAGIKGWDLNCIK
jgi:hypothetical protein